jgi:hypothetical protein
MILDVTCTRLTKSSLTFEKRCWRVADEEPLGR